MISIRKLFRDSKGVAAIEYAMVASLISIAALAGYAQLGNKVQAYFADLNHQVTFHL